MIQFFFGMPNNNNKATDIEPVDPTGLLHISNEKSDSIMLIVCFFINCVVINEIKPY